MGRLESTVKRQIPLGGNILLAATICAILVAPFAHAQVQWAERIASTTSLPGGGGPLIWLTLDSQANCYVTGWFDGTNNFGGVTLTNQSVGGSDIFVAKYNSTGALQWAHRAGGTSANINRKSTRLNSSHLGISYAVFCLKKKNKIFSILHP